MIMQKTVTLAVVSILAGASYTAAAQCPHLTTENVSSLADGKNFGPWSPMSVAGFDMPPSSLPTTTTITLDPSNAASSDAETGCTYTVTVDGKNYKLGLLETKVDISRTRSLD